MCMTEYKTYEESIFFRAICPSKPRKVRVKVFMDEFGKRAYQPQGLFLWKWIDSESQTRKPSRLMWELYGPNNSTGIIFEDVSFVGLPVNMKLFEDQKLKLDHFPFPPPKN